MPQPVIAADDQEDAGAALFFRGLYSDIMLLRPRTGSGRIPAAGGIPGETEGKGRKDLSDEDHGQRLPAGRQLQV